MDRECASDGVLRHHGMCTVSNLAYILPVIVVMLQFHKYANIHILILFMFILLCSSTSYHMCRGECNNFPNHRGTSICPDETPICRLRCKRSTLFELRDMDYTVAIMSMTIVFVTILPLKRWIKIAYILLMVVWLILNIDSTSAYSSDKIILLTLPLIPITVLICTLPLVFKRDTASQRRRWIWTLSIFMFLIAGLCFLNLIHESYSVNHSLWHVFSAISVAIIISVTQQKSENIVVSNFSKYRGLGVLRSVYQTEDP